MQCPEILLGLFTLATCIYVCIDVVLELYEKNESRLSMLKLEVDSPPYIGWLHMVVVSVFLCRGADSGHYKECVTGMWHPQDSARSRCSFATS